MGDFQQSPYMDYSDNVPGGDYVSFEAKSDAETLPPPPEKVEKAFQTIKDYLKNPDSIEDVPLVDETSKSVATTTTTTPTTTTTTTFTTTMPTTSKIRDEYYIIFLLELTAL